ncbi:putative ditrans,polycis-polyprenyl diphosphate synthase [(2E,6E)-farnesyl] [Microsporum ferrugineum]
MQITELLSWKESRSQWVQGLIKILIQGPIPKHIAIIMDGNRRFSRSHGLTIRNGHLLGAFALESLMRFLRSDNIIDRRGIRVRVLGRLELLNDNIKEIIDIMVKKTAYNKGPVLNLCFAYTSRDEIARAIEKTVREHCGQTAGNAITQQTLASNMNISDDYPVDILIRTSGVGRLKQFSALAVPSRHLYPNIG